MAKKKFGVSPALTRGLNETISIAENHKIKYRGTLVPLSRIVFDPNNPRQLLIRREEITSPIAKSDPDYLDKKVELEKIKELAHSIEKSGLINPVIVYKDGESYSLVAGERRCLATIMLGSDNIEARVFHERPDMMELKLIQWFENTAREDLTLSQRLNNIHMLYDKYREHVDAKASLTINELSALTGLSSTHASRYLTIMHGPSEVTKAIESGQVTSLKKASYLAGIKDPVIREQALIACIHGESLDALKSQVQQAKKVAKSIKSLSAETKTRGRAATQVDLGKTKNLALAKLIIESSLKQLKCKDALAELEEVDWQDYKSVTKAFAYFMSVLESR